MLLLAHLTPGVTLAGLVTGTIAYCLGAARHDGSDK